MSSKGVSPPAVPPGPSPTGEISIEEALKTVDTTLLDQLIELRAEQARIEEYLEKAGALREKVSQVVWQRVSGDYNARSQAIDTQAAPLRIDAQREYQKLHAIRGRVSAAEQEARLAKEELELRQAVGELGENELRDQLAGPERALEACRRDLETLEAKKAKFVEAFGSEERLSQVLTAARPPEPPQPATPARDTRPRAPEAAPAAPSDEPNATVRTLRPASIGRAAASAGPTPAKPTPAAAARSAAPAPAAATPAPAPAAQPESEEPDMTVLVRRPAASKAAARPRAGTEAPAAQTSGADGDQEDRTFVLPRAALLLSVDEGEPTVHRLAAITGMGRLDDNQLQIARAGVSRHHAVIEGTPDGFRLKDLGSQNGTFLNGERVTERVLADGDRILIGDAKLVFHSPWPKPGTSPQRGT